MPRRKRKPKVKASSRQPIIASVTGTTGTGKSYFTKHELIPTIPGAAVVVTYTGMPEIWEDAPVFDSSKKSNWDFKKGMKQICWYKNEDETAEHIYKYCRNKTLIFDDCKEYMSSNLQENRHFKRLFSSHRHLGLDIILIAHSPNDIPPQVWMYNKLIVIFHTDDEVQKNRIRTATKHDIIAAQKRVTERFSKAYAKRNGSHYGIYEIITP